MNTFILLFVAAIGSQLTPRAGLKCFSWKEIELKNRQTASKTNCILGWCSSVPM